MNLSNPGHRLWSRMDSNFLAVAATSSLTGDISLRRRRRSLGCGVSLRDSKRLARSSARARGRALQGMTLGCTFPRQIFSRCREKLIRSSSLSAQPRRPITPRCTPPPSTMSTALRRAAARGVMAALRTPPAAAPAWPAAVAPLAARAQTLGGARPALLFRVPSSPRAARPRLPSPIPDPPPRIRVAGFRGFANESDDDFKPVRPRSPATTHPNPSTVARALRVSFRAVGFSDWTVERSSLRPAEGARHRQRRGPGRHRAGRRGEPRDPLHEGHSRRPQCGFSNMACQILNFHGVEYASRDVLSSEELRNGIKEFTSWPTIPQVFIDGEFLGGCDILRQMHQDGELEKALKANAK